MIDKVNAKGGLLTMSPPCRSGLPEAEQYYCHISIASGTIHKNIQDMRYSVSDDSFKKLDEIKLRCDDQGCLYHCESYAFSSEQCIESSLPHKIIRNASSSR
jgi:hypothetical protein